MSSLIEKSSQSHSNGLPVSQQVSQAGRLILVAHCVLMLVIICWHFCGRIVLKCSSVDQLASRRELLVSCSAKLTLFSCLFSLSGACLHSIVCWCCCCTSQYVSSTHTHLQYRIGIGMREERVDISRDCKCATLPFSFLVSWAMYHHHQQYCTSALPLLILIHCHFGSQIDNNSRQSDYTRCYCPIAPQPLLPVNGHWPGFDCCSFCCGGCTMARNWIGRHYHPTVAV